MGDPEDVIAMLLLAWAPLFVVALVTAGTVKLYLRMAEKHGWGQPVRADGPQAHLAKKGTPTMGGVAFMPVALVVVGLLAWAAGSERSLGEGLLTAGLGMSLIGFWDDASKVFGGKTQGVKARWRLIAQFAVAVAAVAIMAPDAFWGTGMEPAWLGVGALLPVVGRIVEVLVIVACVNAVNFTDGVDGLAGGTAAIAALGLGGVAYLLGAEVVGVSMLALAGACLGFLLYNRHPAKVFMGDVGSLGIGGMLAAAAVAMRIELAFVLLGAIFWLEMASVVGQVISFRLTGKRILKMAPFHHHLELSGWSETKIVRVAYALQILLSLGTVVLVHAAGMH